MGVLDPKGCFSQVVSAWMATEVLVATDVAARGLDLPGRTLWSTSVFLVASSLGAERWSPTKKQRRFLKAKRRRLYETMNPQRWTSSGWTWKGGRFFAKQEAQPKEFCGIGIQQRVDSQFSSCWLLKGSLQGSLFLSFYILRQVSPFRTVWGVV